MEVLHAGCETLTSDSGVAAAALGQDLTEQVLAAAASVVAMVMVAPFHAGARAEVGMARRSLWLALSVSLSLCFSLSLLLSRPHSKQRSPV